MCLFNYRRYILGFLVACLASERYDMIECSSALRTLLSLLTSGLWFGTAGAFILYIWVSQGYDRDRCHISGVSAWNEHVYGAAIHVHYTSNQDRCALASSIIIICRKHLNMGKQPYWFLHGEHLLRFDYWRTCHVASQYRLRPRVRSAYPKVWTKLAMWQFNSVEFGAPNWTIGIFGWARYS